MLKVKQYTPLPHLIYPISLKVKIFSSFYDVNTIKCQVEKKILLLQIQIQQKSSYKKH